MKPLIHQLSDLERYIKENSKILCLFSGGLDGSYLLYYLSKLSYGKLVALTVDIGGDLDTNAISEFCENLGIESSIVPRINEFAKDFVIPSIAAQATYLGGHPISASLSRPLIAQTALEMAEKLECDVILHTSDRSQNSLRRFNGSLDSLGTTAYFGSPYEFSTISREEKKKELNKGNLKKFNNRLYSSDSNFWGREFEYGNLDDPEEINIPEFLYEWTKKPFSTEKKTIKLTFYQGIPTKFNDTDMDFVSLVNELNLVIGSYGLGRYIGLEEIEDGNKVQEVREMPAAYALFTAYRNLESGCLTAECIREKINLEQLWVREAIEGRWFGLLRKATDAFIKQMAQQVSGSVSYELGEGQMRLTSIKAEKPLYIRDRKYYDISNLGNDAALSCGQG